VGDYVGYDIRGARAGTHLGLPAGSLTFIVSMGAPLEQMAPETGAAESFDVLLAGLHLRPTLIRHDGSMAGIQINFTPLASRVFFDLPPAELAHHTYDLDLISAPVAAELHDRVNSAPTWAARFDAIDRVLTGVFRPDARLPRPEVLESWDLLARTRGRLPVSLVADHVGWSRRHRSAQFQAEYGVGPKEAARVQRFDRARRMISARSAGSADIAATCGFTDQAHLNREFRAFTGVSPSRWLADDDLASTPLHQRGE
jgi:AraC-like DNA-binding protein